MRAYRFLDAHFGLKSLYEKRLKISRIDDLNDPFEFSPFDLSDPNQRLAVRLTRKEIGRKCGVLCFSAAWKNPVIWAHYGDRHRGLCLGFEIPDERDVGRKVEYVAEKLSLPEPPTFADAQAMIFTKFKDWAYEEEIRVWVQLNDEEDGLFYSDFTDTLQLKEVIAGANCTVPRPAIERALGHQATSISIIKARAGFTKFEVVVDQRGFAATA